MKAYIQDLCGDENPVDIDCAILQCVLQDAIFERLVAGQGRKPATMEEVEAICRVVLPYPIPRVWGTLTLTIGDKDEGKTIRWNVE